MEKYVDAIDLYWNRFPFKQGWKGLKDVLSEDHFFMDRVKSDVYMPLDLLIQTSEKANISDPDIQAKIAFWKNVNNDPEYKKLTQLREDKSTLRAMLINKGLLSQSDLPS